MLRATRFGSSPSAVLVIAVLIAAGCDAVRPSPSLTLQPTIEIPADWVTKTSRGGTMRLSLPPWLEPFENGEGLAAKAPSPRPGAEPIWLMGVESGDHVGFSEPYRLAAGQDLPTWIRAHLFDVQVQAISQITVPAGMGVRLDGLVDPGTPIARRLVAVAVLRAEGIAYLQIDGPEPDWIGREADVELLLSTFWVP